MAKNDAERHKRERVILKRAKRRDCRKQLAVYVSGGILVGFVNLYHDGKAFWHDVTTGGKVGRTYPLGDNVWKLPQKTMHEMSGFSNDVNVYAVRF